MKYILLGFIAIMFAINIYALPSTISYQGVLNDNGGHSITGTPDITFGLYSTNNGGGSLWSETHPNVDVVNGLFSVELGSINAFGSLNFNQDLWLEITVDGNTLSPRIIMTVSGNAISTNGAWSASGTNLYSENNSVTIGTNQIVDPSVAKLMVFGGVVYAGAATSNSPGLLFYDSNDQNFKYYDNTNSPNIIATSSNISNWFTANGDISTFNDVVIKGGLGVGNDIVLGENFGLATIKLKEAILRIYFDDTSISGSFPTNNWSLTVNDINDGGDSYFAIEDINGGCIPFKVMAGSPSNSMYIGSNGNIGLGSGTPITKLHLVNDDKPTIRLEQNGSLGFDESIWDISADESNLTIKDITATSTPVTVLATAPTNSLYLNDLGNVGFGNSTPVRKINISGAMRLEPQAIAPSNPSKGDLYFDSNDDILKCYDGTQWRSLW